jgi:hypothetical protein
MNETASFIHDREVAYRNFEAHAGRVFSVDVDEFSIMELVKHDGGMKKLHKDPISSTLTLNQFCGLAPVALRLELRWTI